MGTQLKALEKELMEIKGVIANLPVCHRQIIHSMSFLQQIRDYIDHLGTLYAHIKSYRAAFTPTRLRSTPRFHHLPLGMSALNCFSLPNWPPLSMSLPMTRFTMAPNSRPPSMWARKPFTMNSRWFWKFPFSPKVFQLSLAIR